MATPKERNDERERARVAREAADADRQRPDVPPQQQGDGQPENARELEEHSSSTPEADRERE